MLLKNETLYLQNSLMMMFIAVLFIINKNFKIFTSRRMIKSLHTHIVEYISAIKLLTADTWNHEGEIHCCFLIYYYTVHSWHFCSQDKLTGKKAYRLIKCKFYVTQEPWEMKTKTNKETPLVYYCEIIPPSLIK